MSLLPEKMHNGCLNKWNLIINLGGNMKNSLIIVLLLAVGVAIWFGFNSSQTTNNQEKMAKDCEIPDFAKAIGHEDKWLLHNGCPPREKIK